MKKIFVICFLFLITVGFSQKQSSKIIVTLDVINQQLKIQQELLYYNTSKDTLSFIFLHNWANSYKDKKTPLAKRMLEDYDKSLHFSKKKDRGFSKIIAISSNHEAISYKANEKAPDIIKVVLNQSLKPNDSASITVTYIVKIPAAKFTKYGYRKGVYNLRYWYLTPVVYKNGWELMSNYNMDDLYIAPTDYDIEFKLPTSYILQTDLKQVNLFKNKNSTIYYLHGKDRTDIELHISKKNTFKSYKTKNLTLISNLGDSKLKTDLTNSIVTREIEFIESYLGKYPHDKLLVNKITYDKNPVYGLNQLPKFLNPFNDIFEFDIKLFKALTNKYVNNTLLTNRRKDIWLNDGIQTYLMMKYVEKYYPEVKAMGKVSKIWGIRTYEIAKLDFNDKYSFVYQFAAQKNLDQSLKTQTDSLSTFNRKIVNKYKAGIGLQYLDAYLNNDIVKQSLQQYYTYNNSKITHSKSFKKIIETKTTKNLNWFFGNYLQSQKKMDYTIKKVTKKKDSIKITIKNRRNITMPVLLYGIKDKNIQFKKWITNIDSSKTVTIAKGDFNRLSLNYENLYPELNLRNNSRNLRPSLLNKPIQFRFLKDIDNPYYNQVFYNLEYSYNFYDGIILGTSISNKTILKKNWLYNITPNYGFKSQKLVGSFSTVYEYYPEKSSVYRLRFGVAGSNFHYAPDLSFNRISPFIIMEFNRKTLRDVGGKSVLARYIYIDRETEANTTALESDNYGILNLRYVFSKPEIIKDLRYNFDFQLADNFSKIALDLRYRKLTTKNRQFDFRLFAGVFLNNKTNSDYFNFSLNRPTDYLFDLNYLGRSEDSGFLNQQLIIAEGGFKSFFDNNMANQWMLTTNNSFSIWRWLEIYGDVGLFKNKGENSVFKYDSGIRFNFIHNILEIYLPLQSSNGFEPKQPNYSTKIRFVITLSLGRILNFVKRGFY